MKKPLSSRTLALLLALVYFSSYVTRINFAAIIQEIITATGFAKSALSVIPVCLSITYGTGQIINGIIGDRVKPQTMILCGISCVSAMNLIFPFFSASIPAMCVLWAINGFAQAMMWPPIVKILVCTMKGTSDLFHNMKRLKKTPVRLHLVDVIPAEEVKAALGDAIAPA